MPVRGSISCPRPRHVRPMPSPRFFPHLLLVCFLMIHGVVVSAGEAAYDRDSRRELVESRESNEIKALLESLADVGTVLAAAEARGTDLKAPLPQAAPEAPPSARKAQTTSKKTNATNETLENLLTAYRDAEPSRKGIALATVRERIGLTEDTWQSARTEWLTTAGLVQPFAGTLEEAGLLMDAVLKTRPDAAREPLLQPVVTSEGLQDRTRRRLYLLDQALLLAWTAPLTNDTVGSLLLFANPRSDGSMRRLVGWGSAPSGIEAARRALGAVVNGYREYETLRVVQKGDIVGRIRIYKGDEPEVEVAAARKLFVSVPRGELPVAGDESESPIRTEIRRPDPITAPVDKGAELGELIVTLRGRPLGTVPLVAKTSVGRGGVLTRIADELRLALKRADAR